MNKKWSVLWVCVIVSLIITLHVCVGVKRTDNKKFCENNNVDMFGGDMFTINLFDDPPEYMQYNGVNEKCIIRFHEAQKILHGYLLMNDDHADEEDLVFYEDKHYLYYTNRKKSPILAYWSLYAKFAGGRMRKNDGCMYMPGTHTWMPTGYVPFTRADFYKKAKQWKTTGEINQQIGPGYFTTYSILYTNDVCANQVIQHRTYHFIDCTLEVLLLNGRAWVNDYDEGVNCTLVPIPGWIEGNPSYVNRAENSIE